MLVIILLGGVYMGVSYTVLFTFILLKIFIIKD